MGKSLPTVPQLLIFLFDIKTATLLDIIHILANTISGKAILNKSTVLAL